MFFVTDENNTTAGKKKNRKETEEKTIINLSFYSVSHIECCAVCYCTGNAVCRMIAFNIVLHAGCEHNHLSDLLLVCASYPNYGFFNFSRRKQSDINTCVIQRIRKSTYNFCNTYS